MTTYIKKHKTKDGRVYMVKVTETYIRQLSPAEQNLPSRLLKMLLPKEGPP